MKFMPSSFAVRSSLFALVAATASGSVCGQIYGRWLYGYQHPSTPLLVSPTPPASSASWPAPDPNHGTVFEAINLAVIPVINKVIAWDNTGVNLSLAQPWPQRLSVGDPESGQFTNYIVNIPAGYGDLFCSGHCWLPDGRLFVAGGNTLYPYPNGTPTSHFEGSRFVGFWDPAQANTPPDYGWNFSLLTGAQPKPMNKRRWYPTVTLISNTKVMVSGGSESTSPSYDYCANPPVPQPDGAFNTYEVFDLQANDWERDTPTSPQPRLYNGPTTGAFCTPVLGVRPGYMGDTRVRAHG